MGVLKARILERVGMPSSKASTQPRDRLVSPELQEDYLLSEPPGRTKNTSVGSLSLLQGIIPAQGLNLHCRPILYHLSYLGSPFSVK